MTNNYILITPIKDEVENLEKLKETIFNQTTRPLLWVIVDSGSSDDSAQVANSLFKDYDWIKVISQQKFLEQGYSHLNFSQAIDEGYLFAKDFCLKHNYQFSFIGKTDATPVLSNNYFSSLMDEMEKAPKTVIACGTQRLLYKGKLIYIEQSKHFSLTTFNDIRLYRKTFFDEANGYPLTPSPDVVLMVKALRRNLNVKIVRSAYFVKPRLGGSKIGAWKGNALKGKNMYILGYNPLLAFLNAFSLSVNYPPHYQIIPMMQGFVSSAVVRSKKIDDYEVMQYFWKYRLNEVLRESLHIFWRIS